MEKTGERYSAARASILSTLALEGGVGQPRAARSKKEAEFGYPFRAGVCKDTGAARNMLSAIGVREPRSGRPLSEAMVTGLSGGIGFLYIVFEYKGTPPLLSVLMRFDSSADQFVLGGLKRLGLGLEVTETTSAAKAEKSLDAALAEGRPALCVVDLLSVFTPMTPGVMKGMAPAIVVATAGQGDEIVIDAGTGSAQTLSRREFAEARGAFKKGKNKLAVAREPGAIADLPGAIDGAISACLDRYENAPYKGFASNFGFAGMEKWANLLTDARDPKCWAKLFPEGQAACLGLRRAYQGIEYEMTGPGGGRAMYAGFLRESADICGHKAYAKAAARYDTCAERWSAISSFISGCGVKEVKTGCELLDAYTELLDTGADARARDEAAGELRESAGPCDVSRDQARAIYSELSALVRQAIEAEREAVGALTIARAERV